MIERDAPEGRRRADDADHRRHATAGSRWPTSAPATRRRSSAPPRTGCARASSTSSPTGRYGDPPPPAGRARPRPLRRHRRARARGALARRGRTPPSSTRGRRRWRSSGATSAGWASEEAARVIARDATRLGRNPGRGLRPRLSRPALRARARREGGRLGARRRLGGAGRARGLGGGRQPSAAARLDPSRPAPLWGHDDRDLPLDRPPPAPRCLTPAACSARSGASPTSAPARRRSCPRWKRAATSSPSCRPAAASRSATSSRR